MTSVSKITEGAAFRPPLISLHKFSPCRSARAAGLILVAAVAACAPAHATDALRVAFALPLTGPQQLLGREIKAAVELAVADTNQTSGDGGPLLDITWYDDRCSSDGGLAVAKAITSVVDATMRPAIVMGHACPSAAQAAGTLYNAASVPQFTVGSLPARAPSTHRFGPGHFRLPSDGTQGATIGAALAELPEDARIAFVRDRTQFAQSTLQAVAAALGARKRTIILVETFAGAEKDFTALAQRIHAAKITHIALAAFPSEAVLLLAEINKANPGLTIFATDQLADAEFGRSAGASADGVRVALAPDIRAFPGAATVAKRLEVKGLHASRAAIASYAAIEIMTQVARGTTSQSGASPPPALLPNALASETFKTVLGDVTFTESGAANIQSHIFYTWTNGALLPPRR